MFHRLVPYIGIYALIQILLRVSIAARAHLDIGLSPLEVGEIMLRGAWFDLVTGAFVILPIAIYHALLPAERHGATFDRRADLALRFIFSFALLFESVAEHFFWTEFSSRFNFIAVDYLVYTHEVIGNIVESYPIGWLISAVAALAALIAWISVRVHPLDVKAGGSFARRGIVLAGFFATAAGLTAISNIDQTGFKHNAIAGEVAANGVYNLFHAFWNNEIHYDRFYASEDDAKVATNARALLWEGDEGIEFVHDDGRDLTRLVQGRGPEKRKNVIVVAMESMGASYMAAFGDKLNITPNLDRLAKEGLFFTKAYATGTRTVRGLEALTLSIPPTPGQSIIRRPGNDNLYSLGFVFRDRGYDTKFIYGGYGYFDNMNTFFAGNGFDILDRSNMANDEISFANIWGICDEDMFMRAIREGDKSAAEGKPFMHLIMTTSNHRPYTYPDGKVAIPSHSHRFGGAQYADFSIGRLVEEARKRPWFKDTVFVFVADHTSGAGGKAELDAEKYHIPMIFYAPGFIGPRRFDNIASQIDMAPILLGLLDFRYFTKFYGEDLLNDDDEIPHAFISNYQKIALVKDDELTVLAPKQSIEQYRWSNADPLQKADSDKVDDAIAYYQSASWWRDNYKRIPTVPGAQ